MKRLRILLTFTIICSFILTGCGAKAESMAQDNMYVSTTAAAAMDGYYSDMKGEMSPEAPMENGALGAGAEAPEAKNPEEKLIYTAHVSIETMEYDTAVASIQGYIKEVGGFIESSDFSSNSGYDRYDGSRYTGSRHANITARIPQQHYNEFLEKTPEWGVVQNQNSYFENITQQYNDVSLQLDSLNIQHERLLEMLEKATKLDDMIRIEESLANVRWQINSITSQLKNWDNEVSYSTVHINLNEVKQYTPTEKDSFMTRMSKAFKNGFEDYGEFLADSAVILTHGLPFIITFGIVILVVVKIIRKGAPARKAKKEAQKQAAIEKIMDENEKK